jgi:hypothetical protein
MLLHQTHIDIKPFVTFRPPSLRQHKYNVYWSDKWFQYSTSKKQYYEFKQNDMYKMCYLLALLLRKTILCSSRGEVLYS